MPLHIAGVTSNFLASAHVRQRPKPPLAYWWRVGYNQHSHISGGAKTSALLRSGQLCIGAGCILWGAFTLFLPPTHAHLYYLLTCVADDVVLLAFREVLVDHGRLFAGVLALITVYNTSACVYLCAHALRSYAALYMRLLHDIPWPCPLAGDLWGMVDLYIHQMERGDDTAILIGHRSGAVECMWWGTFYAMHPPYTHAGMFWLYSCSPLIHAEVCALIYRPPEFWYTFNRSY